ncbi:MAG: hypothetical protein WCY02_00855 [Parvibaculum sp.]
MMSRFFAQLIVVSLLWGCLSAGASADSFYGEANEAIVHATGTERAADSTSGSICDVCHILQHVVLVPRSEFLVTLATSHVPVSGDESAASRLLYPEGPPPEIAIA